MPHNSEALCMLDGAFTLVSQFKEATVHPVLGKNTLYYRLVQQKINIQINCTAQRLLILYNITTKPALTFIPVEQHYFQIAA